MALTVNQARVLAEYRVRTEEPKSRNGKRTLPLDDGRRLPGLLATACPPRAGSHRFPALSSGLVVSSPQCLELVEGLTRRGVSGAPPHPQSAKQKGAEEHDNADK